MGSESSGPLRLLRETHEERVLSVLRARGPLTRAQLAEQTNLSRATLSSIVQTLLNKQALVEAREVGAVRGRGRPVSVVSLNPAGGLALGIDLGQRRIQVTISNVAHEFVASGAVACADRTPWPRRLQLALDLVDDLTTRHDISLIALAGVGVGIVGPVSTEGSSGVGRSADRIALVRDTLRARFGVPVHVDNNTRLAALAEAVWGAGAGVDSALYLRLSYGVGGGIVLGGRLLAGAGGAAGELGHISVDRDGPACSCGGRGCLERYVSLTTLQEQSENVLDARDDKARDLLAVAGARVGEVLAAACNTVNPEVVVIGGELAETGDHLFKPLQTAFRRHTHSQVHRSVRITRAALGPDAAARGGIALVLTSSPASPNAVLNAPDLEASHP
ncbi:ROK family transcriptional regulator [Kribbella speibonae]|uniref:ROK family transcriptional regulator n=1 Tax=Kribbella speibonae TaxID=1572660 RepID=A0A4R0ILJ4_9ACTN|nr:ROK family transcriptional regulator [Kribbella speibonae]TCC33124.1 ROK family transcriptional regulator [Kribbella speibonae]